MALSKGYAVSIDWERHFRAMKPSGPRPAFGSVLGEHTVAELKDLLAAKQVEIDRVDQAYQKIVDQGPPTKEVSDWKLDWDLLKVRWADAKKEGQAAIDAWSFNLFVPDNMAAAESQYVGVIKALSQAYPELHTSPGDLIDLSQRLTKLGGTIDNGPIPQPSPDSDFDFNVLHTTDTITTAAQQAVKPLLPSTKTLILIAVGVGAGLVLLPRLLMPLPLRMMVR